MISEVGLDSLVGCNGEGVSGVRRKNSASTGPVGEGVVGVWSGTQCAGTAASECAATGHGAASRRIGSCGYCIGGSMISEVGLDSLVGCNGEGVSGVRRKNSASTGPVGEGVVGVWSGTQCAGTAASECAATGHGAASRRIGSGSDGVGGGIGKGDIVNVVAAEVPRVASGKNVAESNIVSATRVGGETDSVEHLS